MIRFIKYQANQLRYIIEYLRFVFWILRKSNSKIFIVDLDNTLADTWPQRLNMDSFNWHNMPVHESVLNFVKEYEQINKLEVVVISARPLSAKRSTRLWLNRIAGLEKTRFFLTPDADSKFKYIVLAKRLGKLGAVIDDCSHSHEFGTTLFHQNLIQKIRSLDIEFFDYQFLSKLQNH